VVHNRGCSECGTVCVRPCGAAPPACANVPVKVVGKVGGVCVSGVRVGWVTGVKVCGVAGVKVCWVTGVNVCCVTGVNVCWGDGGEGLLRHRRNGLRRLRDGRDGPLRRGRSALAKPALERGLRAWVAGVVGGVNGVAGEIGVAGVQGCCNEIGGVVQKSCSETCVHGGWMVMGGVVHKNGCTECGGGVVHSSGCTECGGGVVHNSGCTECGGGVVHNSGCSECGTVCVKPCGAAPPACANVPVKVVGKVGGVCVSGVNVW